MTCGTPCLANECKVDGPIPLVVDSVVRCKARMDLPDLCMSAMSVSHCHGQFPDNSGRMLAAANGVSPTQIGLHFSLFQVFIFMWFFSSKYWLEIEFRRLIYVPMSCSGTSHRFRPSHSNTADRIPSTPSACYPPISCRFNQRDLWHRRGYHATPSNHSRTIWTLEDSQARHRIWPCQMTLKRILFLKPYEDSSV